jgi:mono/diheme cytochrome c family protein
LKAAFDLAVPPAARPNLNSGVPMKRMVFTLAALAAFGLAIGLPAASDLYKSKCAGCHGAKGTTGGNANTNFAKKGLLNDVTDEQIFDAIKNGSKAKSIKVGARMPAYGNKLSDAEIKGLAAEVREMSGTKAPAGDKKEEKKAKK